MQVKLVVLKNGGEEMNLIPANWKPIVIAVVGIVMTGIQGYSAMHGTNDWKAALEDRTTQTIMLVSVLGLVTKQHNVTGGEVPQTKEAKYRIAADTTISTENAIHTS